MSGHNAHRLRPHRLSPAPVWSIFGHCMTVTSDMRSQSDRKTSLKALSDNCASSQRALSLFHLYLYSVSAHRREGLTWACEISQYFAFDLIQSSDFDYHSRIVTNILLQLAVWCVCVDRPPPTKVASVRKKHDLQPNVQSGFERDFWHRTEGKRNCNG